MPVDQGAEEEQTARLIPGRRAGRLDELEDQIRRLRSRIRLAVVHGGDKSIDGAVIHRTSNPRAWHSYLPVAEEIAAALKRLGFQRTILIPDDMRLGDTLLREEVDLVWLNTAGVQGYNPVSHAPAMLEMLGVPYIGHNPLMAGTLDNKHIFKQELANIDVATAPFVTWHPARGPFRPHVNGRFLETFKDHLGPYVVKPVSGRASHEVRFVEDQAELTRSVAEVFAATENHVLIEAYLPGREFCVAVCGRVVVKQGRFARLSEPFTFAAAERRLGGEKIFAALEGEPGAGQQVSLLDPRGDKDLMNALHEIARKIWVELNLESLVRLDLREDAEGNLQVIEANPKPDLRRATASGSNLLAAALPAVGMDYDDLILSLLADRLDVLFSRRRGAVHHLTALLA